MVNVSFLDGKATFTCDLSSYVRPHGVQPMDQHRLRKVDKYFKDVEAIGRIILKAESVLRPKYYLTGTFIK